MLALPLAHEVVWNEPPQADHPPLLLGDVLGNISVPAMDLVIGCPRAGQLPEREEVLPGPRLAFSSDLPDNVLALGLPVLSDRLALVIKFPLAIPIEDVVEQREPHALMGLHIERVLVQPQADLQLLAELSKSVNLLLANLANRSKNKILELIYVLPLEKDGRA